MMYRLPSGRLRRRNEAKLNLIPILDAVFIFIFFLLVSANFIKIFEIASDVPIVSVNEPPKSKKIPLALTLRITDNKLLLFSGVPARLRRSFTKNTEDKYDLTALHNYLIRLKKANVDERTIIFEPQIDIPYEELVEIMDAARLLRTTDDDIWTKDKDGLDQKVDRLFDRIIFGNILS